MTGPADTTIDHGRPSFVFRTGQLSGRIAWRSLVVVLILAIATLAVVVASLLVGTMSIDLGEVIGSMFGSGDPQQAMVLLQWRMPRVLFAVTCGLVLAISGAIFQSLTRNPLGSPDVIGFETGSHTGALVVLLALGSTSYSTVAAGSLIGGVATAAVVFLLSYSRGIKPFRLIIVGIAVAALLSSVNSLMLMRVSLERAMMAAVWGAGSLGDLGFDQFVPFALAVAVLLVGAAAVARPLRQLELGDDAALALGSRATRVRLAAIAVGVALTAAVTAAVGPIGFIALAAPQISRRLTGGHLLELLPVALTGALLLTSADFIAQFVDVPVGIVTVTIGGSYLVWLLSVQFASRGRNSA